MTEFLKGKKTYIVAVIAGALAVAEALGHPVPSWVYAALAASGLYTTRSAISRAGL
jgi:hypothetical protein